MQVLYAFCFVHSFCSPSNRSEDVFEPVGGNSVSLSLLQAAACCRAPLCFGCVRTGMYDDVHRPVQLICLLLALLTAMNDASKGRQRSRLCCLSFLNTCSCVSLKLSHSPLSLLLQPSYSPLSVGYPAPPPRLLLPPLSCPTPTPTPSRTLPFATIITSSSPCRWRAAREQNSPYQTTPSRYEPLPLLLFRPYRVVRVVPSLTQILLYGLCRCCRGVCLASACARQSLCH